LTKKALKESHADEIEYHNIILQELNRQCIQIWKRKDALYEDKLDEIITKESYE
jgi:hypothetical protein